MKTITFIGAGNMASCLIGGLIANGYDAKKIWATNPIPEKLQFLREKFNINVTPDNKQGALKNLLQMIIENLLKENNTIFDIKLFIHKNIIKKELHLNIYNEKLVKSGYKFDNKELFKINNNIIEGNQLDAFQDRL